METSHRQYTPSATPTTAVEPAPSAAPPRVQGTVRDASGTPLAHVVVTLIDKRIRSERVIGTAATDANGHYNTRLDGIETDTGASPYVPQKAPVNLVVRAASSDGATLATS